MIFPQYIVRQFVIAVNTKTSCCNHEIGYDQWTHFLYNLTDIDIDKTKQH